MMLVDKSVSAYARHKNDTGSSEVQVVLLSLRINNIKKHLEDHKKDYSALRGMLAEINQRRRCLSYIKRYNKSLYSELIKKIKDNSF